MAISTHYCGIVFSQRYSEIETAMCVTHALLTATGALENNGLDHYATPPSVPEDLATGAFGTKSFM